MCGICGYFHDRRVKNEVLYDMNQTIDYRGPDDEGYYYDTDFNGFEVGLAQKRLSIIELSKLGHQPMKSIDEDVVVVFNGEIYNYKEIKEELLKNGFTFKSNSDTEVIVYAYQMWGINCISRFIGMFAIAIYDKNDSSLYLVRDRLGIKPLYYYWDNKNIVFGSELKPIMKYPYFKKNINVNALHLYLHHHYITAPQTIFDNTYKVEAGQIVKYRLGNIEKSAYWSIENAYQKREDLSKIEEREAIYSLKNKLEDSVKLRMISDVPLGAFLSGGIDSSLVASVMQSLSSKPIETFTIGFEEDSYNEANYAKKISDYLGTNHHEEYFSINKAKDFINKIPELYDEPFADSSQLPMMLVSQMARKHVTVSLSGDAGDELFCGYKRYDKVLELKKYRFLSKLTNPLLKSNIVSNSVLNSNASRRLIKFANLSDDNSIINADYLTYVQLFNNITNSSIDIDRKYFELLHLTTNIQEKHMLQDLATYLPDDILTKVDRASMYSSLEARTPLLDHRFVEYALALPHNLKFRNGEKKYILKRLLSEYIPNDYFSRPKMGFSIPVYKWLRTDLRFLVEEAFEIDFLRRQNIFNMSMMDAIYKNFKLGIDPYYDNLTWAIVVFQMWYREYID
ncbi:asparagine synthase (glutamine-hydrolyzing) [Fusibacter sp. JL216-2]|uniref:asparagine synthase (glutamine-hydrolyzing) n=1 Tax=Fusibacter sp. JL216-2 TaxID=3071453 RepID=UPI003D32E177